MCPLNSTPTPEGVIIIQPKTSFLEVVLDGNHDFEGPIRVYINAAAVLASGTSSSRFRRRRRARVAEAKASKRISTSRVWLLSRESARWPR